MIIRREKKKKRDLFCPKVVSTQFNVLFEGTRGIGKPGKGHHKIGAVNCKKKAKVKFVMVFCQKFSKKVTGQKLKGN